MESSLLRSNWICTGIWYSEDASVTFWRYGDIFWRLENVYNAWCYFWIHPLTDIIEVKFCCLHTIKFYVLKNHQFSLKEQWSIMHMLYSMTISMYICDIISYSQRCCTHNNRILLLTRCKSSPIITNSPLTVLLANKIKSLPSFRNEIVNWNSIYSSQHVPTNRREGGLHHFDICNPKPWSRVNQTYKIEINRTNFLIHRWF